MSLDAAGFRERIPGIFADRTDTEIAVAIDEARLISDVLEEATLYLAAHLIAVKSEWQSTPDGGSGVVSKETIGPRSIEYMTTAGESERRAFFSTTPFGRMYMTLEDRTPRAGIGAMFV